MSLHTNRRYSEIGLDRLVRLKWLERTAHLCLAGNDELAVKKTLQDELSGAFRSNKTNVRGSLDKTITILMKIWVRPPQELHRLQREGLEFLTRLPRPDQIAVHWGMAMAVYPFWGRVATHVGRLLRLQGRVVAGQVQRRVMEQYGERETVSRRVRYVLRSFIDWGVLEESSEQGVYIRGRVRDIERPEFIAWLAEAVLHSFPDGRAPMTAVLDCTGLFPFRLTPISAERLVALSKRLDLLRHGLDQDLIMLRRDPI